MSHAEVLQLCRVAEMYASWGLSIIPVGGEKLPTVKWKGRQTRRVTAERLAKDFAYIHPKHGPAMGLAVVHGRVSCGLACRDFDIDASYRKWADEYPEAAARLPTVRTPRGYHVWFRTKVESYHKSDDGEYRANSTHYSVVPPSVRTDKDGFVYSWVANEPTGITSFPVIDPVALGLRPPYRPNEVPTPFIRKEWVVDFNTYVSPYSLSLRPSPDTTGIQTVLESEEMRGTDGQEHEYDHGFVGPPPKLDTAVGNAIRCCLPKRAGERHDHIFLLARRLKAIRPTAEADEWEDAVREWWRQSVRVIGTKEFSVSWRDFLAAWKICRPFVSGNDPVSRARRAAEQESGSDSKMRAVCRELARPDPSGTFMLASTLAGDLTGLSQQTALHTLNRLVRRGEIVLVEQSRKMNMGKGHVYRLNETGRFLPTEDNRDHGEGNGSQ